MIRTYRFSLICIGALSAFAAPALADFAGQTILGPLTAGSSITGDLTGASDDNDGFTSGTHIFDIWDGGDVVYGLDWAGGDMLLTLTSLDFNDPDLFLYTPGSLDDSADYSITNGIDSVMLAGAAPGFYYIVVDTTAFGEGEFQLDVALVPAPGALALLGVAMVGARRRRRVA